MKLTDRVTFVGEVPPEDVRAIMNCCDLFLFPSLWEAMPMALLEAMAAGMPIVASNIPANCEALQDTGVLVPPEPTQLVAAITELLNNPAAAAELGRKAAVRAHHFTVDSMVDGYERLFTAGSSKAPSRVDRHAPVQASLSRVLRPVETAGESNRRQQ
jgi:glycosyltransferase involved in cell wall biosynthesis